MTLRELRLHSFASQGWNAQRAKRVEMLLARLKRGVQ